MATIDTTIVLISLPAIFRGININPFSSFQYLLWILFGYSIVTATLLVTFGKISNMLGRVKLYNLGFAVFTAGSLLCAIIPSQGNLGAIELIIFRIIQGIGGAFLLANGAPSQVAKVFSSTPPTSALFGAFLGYNPIKTIFSTLPQSLVSSMPATALQQITANTFFSNAIAPPFMTSLKAAFAIGAIMCFVAAVFSMFRGGKYVYGQAENKAKTTNSPPHDAKTNAYSRSS